MLIKLSKKQVSFGADLPWTPAISMLVPDTHHVTCQPAQHNAHLL